MRFQLGAGAYALLDPTPLGTTTTLARVDGGLLHVTELALGGLTPSFDDLAARAATGHVLQPRQAREGTTTPHWVASAAIPVFPGRLDRLPTETLQEILRLPTESLREAFEGGATSLVADDAPGYAEALGRAALSLGMQARHETWVVQVVAPSKERVELRCEIDRGWLALEVKSTAWHELSKDDVLALTSVARLGAVSRDAAGALCWRYRIPARWLGDVMSDPMFVRVALDDAMATFAALGDAVSRN